MQGIYWNWLNKTLLEARVLCNYEKHMSYVFVKSQTCKKEKGFISPQLDNIVDPKGNKKQMFTLPKVLLHH